MQNSDLVADKTRWDEEFVSAAAELPEQGRDVAFPAAYKHDFTPERAVRDAAILRALTPESPMKLAVEADGNELHLKVYRRGGGLTLSKVMPHLTYLGVEVTTEHPYTVAVNDTECTIYDFALTHANSAQWNEDDKQRFMDAFAASYEGACEADLLNSLVVDANLSWVEVSWLRAIQRYLQQAGVSYTQGYITEALVSNPAIAAALVKIFRTKFDPAAFSSMEERRAAVDAEFDSLTETLKSVASLDHDTITRRFMEILKAATRTNAFQDNAPALAIKLLPREVSFLPEPRPMFEITVYSPRIEGVHLRYGMVARGGLRWSDRREDFRTEILGLVKAQMVKNTVIVPVGAKGGFYPKQLPNPAVDRGAWQAEGVESYKIFISSLLTVTDNIVKGEIVPATNVVRWDDDDPYLVVAADKGTATFSDIANQISLDRGHWLGDAFASGGSIGYDHKGMGITAKGAWESVKRHFREMGIDSQAEDFTCVGIGDMGGDVFGNGMMLSEHIRLVAAFNHLHIFLDPNPDSAISFKERVRMFNERQGWDGYNTDLISEGGGVHSRSAKSIAITPQVREALGLPEGTTEMAPNDLVNACLKAPVDLLWNGGIGTYVKAETETHEQVGDKANDSLRVNGNELRCKILGEGGNLGATQLGRIEFAKAGGKVNTDFVDNSAGVDTSDHEVNLKILFAEEIAKGHLTMEERNELIPTLTDEIEKLVLAHNISQNRCLQASNIQTARFAPIHEDWMQALEADGYLDRKVQFMPSHEEMLVRISKGEALTNPELCTLLAWTKIKLEDDVLASSLPDDEYLVDTAINYFPSALREKYADAMRQHRLYREIITTEVVNKFVDTMGITAYHRIFSETGASIAEILRGFIAAWEILDGDKYTAALAAHKMLPAQTSIELRMELRKAVERATRWLLANRPSPLDIASAVDTFKGAIVELREAEGIVTGPTREDYLARQEELKAAGVDADVARDAAAARYLATALPVVQIAKSRNMDVDTVAKVFFGLGDKLGLNPLGDAIQDLPNRDRWDAMSRSALRDDLTEVSSRLTADALAAGEGKSDVDEVLAAWSAATGEVSSKAATLAEITAGDPSLARLMVAMRILRSMQKSTV